MARGQTIGRERGGEAESPRQIPKAGWKDVLWRVKDDLEKDHVSIVAPGVAFYAFLAIFPALAAIVSIYGLFVDPQQAAQQIEGLTAMLPEDARRLLTEQTQSVAGSTGGALGFGMLISIGLALWSAQRGMMGLIQALNITYGETEKRGFIRLYATSLALTVGAVLFIIITLGLVAILPVVVGMLGLGGAAEWAIRLLRWPILFGAVLVLLAGLYRFAPSRDGARWQWLTPGALMATLMWMLGSIAFSLYVSRFEDYNATYGTLGAVVALMMWFLLTAYVILLGAEINNALEKQTVKDSTQGEPKPMGRRGATAADTQGKPYN
ncbi:YihY/virulence factor BrkB family protein [Telmatospirillum sp. J64-1]|uniref:YihY/virulence factor BrkB family protein n=1 Tax=Telmatospirillum sp. J64-1 TaxID=2502183 RepID=UPI00115F6A69|nr:YihY/virulence factor BrkB family protein [Telmatospirillum sp. J64-1]